MKYLCIYHGNCADGFSAAWVVRKALGEENVEFYSGVYQQLPPDVNGRNVIIVDFSYKRAVIEAMRQSAESILILDHHKTAKEDLEGYIGTTMETGAAPIEVVFDMERSGAMITWDYFFPTTLPPRLLMHVQDRDLWLFSLPHTREIQANLFSYPYDFTVWDDLMDRFGRDGDFAISFIAEGQAIERKHHKDINEYMKAAATRALIAGHDVPVLNAPYFWSSDAGHIMAQGEKFAACYWDTPKGRVYSLRSTKEGMDVSQIAKLFGGGGHHNAAGFTVPCPPYNPVAVAPSAVRGPDRSTA